MTQQPIPTPLPSTLVLALTVLMLAPVSAQTPAHLRLTAIDADGVPVNKLTREDLTLRSNGVKLDVISVAPASPTAQIVAIFEDLAVTQRQLNDAIAQFIGSLDETSTVDMQSVDGRLDDAITLAVADLHARAASRPVIVMMGQASEIAPSELPSSQVRGRRRAADLSGNVPALAQLLANHGILFYGVAVTDVDLPNFQTLAARTGGRFERLPDSTRLNETLASIGLELGSQLLISYVPNGESDMFPHLETNRADVTLRAAPVDLTH